MVYRLPPVLSRLPVPSRATRSTFPSPPYRFAVSSRAIRPTFPPRPCRFPVLSRAIRPTFPPRPCRFPVSLRAIHPTFPPRPCQFSLRCALFARRSRLSVRFPVAPCVTRSASLPVRCVSRSVPFRASCAAFFLSPCTIVLDEHLCSLAVCWANGHIRVRYNSCLICVVLLHVCTLY